MIVKRIKDIAKVRRGASPRPIDDPKYFGGEVGWVRIADVTISGKYLRKTTQYVSPLGESLSVRVNKGDLIISIAGSVGKSIIVDMPACIHDGFVQIYDLKDTETEFLYYYLKFVEKGLHRFGQSGTQTNLNRDIVGNIQFTWLPKTEQIRIAEILSTADEAIAHTEALIAKYQRIKTGLMQDLLTRGIDENGTIRSKETHKFVVKNGIEVPEEWEVDSLGLYSNLHNNLRKPISAIERYEKKGIYPYYGATGIIDFINEFRVEGKFVLIGEDGDHYLKFEKQDMTHLVEGRFNVSNHAHIMSGKGQCSTEWIHYYYCSRDITYYLTRQGAGRYKLNKAALQKLPICVPEPKEQERIISTIESFNKNVNNELHTLSKLQSIKTGLMQDLLSGKKRLNFD